MSPDERARKQTRLRGELFCFLHGNRQTKILASRIPSLQVVLNMDMSIGQVQLRKPKLKDAAPKLFTFDGVYFTLDTTEQIYEVMYSYRHSVIL